MDAIGGVADTITTYASQGASSAWVLAGNFLVLFILTLVMIGFSYKAGRGGIISLLVAFYAGYAIYIVFPYTDQIVGAGGTTATKAIISIVLYGIATFLPFHFIQRLVGSGFGVLSFVPRFALSFLAAAFLLAVAYHVFQVSNVYEFPAPINSLFEPDRYFFWWFIAPLLGLLFFIH
jgi:uncharacterized membrane-anchored protein